MKNNLIKAIFTNLLFVIGVVFVIFGFIRGTITASYIVIFDKYPLDQYKETMCDTTYTQPYMMLEDSKKVAEADKKTLEEKLKKCEKQIEVDRKVTMATDIAVSITTLVSGAALVYFFRRFIFGK